MIAIVSHAICTDTEIVLATMVIAMCVSAIRSAAAIMRGGNATAEEHGVNAGGSDFGKADDEDGCRDFEVWKCCGVLW